MTTPQKPTADPAGDLGAVIRALSWTDQARRASLDTLVREADRIGAEQTAYYLRKSGPKKKMASYLRMLAILAGAAGVLLPLIATAGNATANGAAAGTDPAAAAPSFWSGLASWGYVSFALAAAFIGADRAFGLSSSWIRFMSSHLMLHRALTQFRFEWAQRTARWADTTPPANEVEDTVQWVVRFVESVNAEVQRETEAWAKEFMSALAELEKSVRAQKDAAEPGAIQVRVKGTSGVSGLGLRVDGGPGPVLAGQNASIPLVPPGRHVIEAFGTRGDQLVADSRVIEVKAGGIASLELDLTAA